MKRLALALFVLCIDVALPQQAFPSGLCCALSGDVQERLLGVAVPESRRLSLQFTSSFTLMDKLREGTKERSLKDVIDEGRFLTVPARMEMTTYAMTAAYRFSPEFSAFATVPYIRNTMDMATVTDFGDLGTNIAERAMEPVRDIGDVSVMGLYRLYANDEIRPTDSITLGAGIKTPTGSSTKKFSSGRFVHAHMQPGTGSWDPLLSLIYTRTADRFLFQADMTYQIATRNSNGYMFGDSLMTNLAGRYEASSFFRISGGLIYFHLNRADDRDGKYTDLTSVMDDPENTGGDSIWLSPAVQVLPLRNGAIDLKAQFPVWQRLNGIQLASRYRIIAGISYAF